MMIIHPVQIVYEFRTLWRLLRIGLCSNRIKNNNNKKRLGGREKCIVYILSAVTIEKSRENTIIALR